MSQFLPHFLGTVVILVAAANSATAAPPERPKKPKLDDATKAAVNRCLSIIRGCQLPDGAFRVKADGNPIWVNSYFGNYGALSLLAAHERSPDPRLVAEVGEWLRWQARHQLADGTINDWEGGITEGYHDNGKRDSVDSYAAMYLLVIERHQRLSRKIDGKVKLAAIRALSAIESVVHDDTGLTFAKPDYRVMYLFDNVEVFGGLVAASRLFKTIGQNEYAEKATKLAESIAASLPAFYQEEQALFATATFENGEFQSSFDKVYPAGLAQLCGLAWIDSKHEMVWKKTKDTFRPESGKLTSVGSEWWLMAAARIGDPKDVSLYRKQLLGDAAHFDHTNVYIHRPGLTVLALLEAADWLPSRLDAK